MAIEVKLPELGDGIESGDVLEVLVSVGETISKGQDIVEMETDKATVSVPATVGGKVVKICVQGGDSVSVGGALVEIEANEEAAVPATKPVPVKAPEPVAAPPEPAPSSPASEPKESTPVKVDPVPAPQVVSPPVASSPDPPSDSTATDSTDVVPAGPAVRRFAREVGVDLAKLSGSGSGGRITRQDVLEVVRQKNAVPQEVTPSVPAAPPKGDDVSAPTKPGVPSQDTFGPTRIERMSKIRKTIAHQMHVSWSTVPRVTNFDDADVTDLEKLRNSSKQDYAAQGIKLTTMPFLLKAVATALRHHPMLNAIIDQENQQVVYRDYVNLGIAVDTDRGLVVPVLRDTDKLGIPDIARGIAEMAAKVRSGQFEVNDLRGGTFTISNLGAIGGQYSTPIVNVPEVAILLVGRSRKLPVVMPDDSIVPRLMMPLSLAYDHRLVDGGTAARFLNDVIGYLEAPSRLLLAL